MKKLFIVLILFAFFFSLPGYVVAATKPLIGAIRWDDWYGNLDATGHATELSLGSQQWHYRIPFFGKIISNTEVQWSYTQSDMDQEISYAKQAGLSYWAFVTYPPTSHLCDALNFYLTSSHSGDINFANIIEAGRWGGPDIFLTTENRLFSYMAKPTYQKVLNNRPLLFIMNGQVMISSWGDATKVKAMFTTFRQDAASRGLGNPYIVIMDPNVTKANSYKAQFGADAISAYAIQNAGKNSPYTDLMSFAQNFWNTAKNTGSNVIPTVMTGWDRRPRVQNPVPWETPGGDITIFYQQATPQLIKTHLQNAISWVNGNTSTDPANAILIYAWNENDEGGWLVPTLSEGTSRIAALSALLGGSISSPTPSPSPSPTPTPSLTPILGDLTDVGDVPGDQVNIFDYNLVLSNFGNPYTIFDYNNVIQNFGK